MQEYKFPYKWNLSDGYPAKGIEPNACKVFGTFICGGGSTMGYKLAGYDHLGGVEIDPKVADVYRENHKPKHLYVEDIRLFNQRQDLPPELYDLDLLDGSPPCSTFSMAGSREGAWGKKKVFREGQAKQTLDDLVFVYVDTIAKLKPKVCLLENVKGIIQGNAKYYSKQIVARMQAAGYRVQVFLLNAASMGVPQKRERVFFIGLRNDIKLPELVLRFDEKAVRYSEIEDVLDKTENTKNTKGYLLYVKTKEGDSFSKEDPRGQFFGYSKIGFNNIPNTIVSNSGTAQWHPIFFRQMNKIEVCQIGTYPLDYNFKSIEPKYLIGMSVPPVMTAQIGHQIWLQWLSKIKY
jgi:DNA (cytosine-5)-methyltransferase 1